VRGRGNKLVLAAATAATALAFPVATSASFDIAVTQTESADPVFPGDAVTYTATVTNRGTDTFDASGSTSTR
jgi:acyl dehydratase